jgi:hypothetical protein
MKLWKEELQPTILDRIRDEIKPIRDNIQAVKVKCDQIESSQAFLAEKYDSMLELLQCTKKQVSELDQSLKQKEKKIDELEKVLKEQDVKLDEMHQYSRRDCIEITGIPVTSNDNPKQLTVELGELMGIANISEHHISIAHRLPSTRNVKDRLIAKFVHREMRDEFYRRRCRLAGKTSNDLPLISREYDQSTTPTRPNKIHINESLTAYRKRLFGKLITLRGINILSISGQRMEKYFFVNPIPHQFTYLQELKNSTSLKITIHLTNTDKWLFTFYIWFNG